MSQCPIKYLSNECLCTSNNNCDACIASQRRGAEMDKSDLCDSVDPCLYDRWRYVEFRGEFGSVYRCPACGMRFQILDGWIGYYYYCPSCAERLSVPECKSKEKK